LLLNKDIEGVGRDGGINQCPYVFGEEDYPSYNDDGPNVDTFNISDDEQLIGCLIVEGKYLDHHFIKGLRWHKMKVKF
jgi:hypothetical protein